MGIEAALVGGGLGLIGGSMAADAAESAARTSAAAQERAARIGALAGAFRPVGITTSFGRSNFEMGTDPETGLPIVTGAGYELSPELKALQDRLIGAAPGALERGLGAYGKAAPTEAAAASLFNLGAQYLGESPEAVRERYIQQQTALLDPVRQREEERLGRSVFGRGRAGLSVGETGQPELFALASARRQQDLGLAAAADQAAQQQIQFGQGLFGQGMGLLSSVPAYEAAALSPFQAQLAAAQGIEQLGQDPFRLGMEVGGRQSQAGQAGGSLLAQGGMNAAQTRLQGSLVGPTMLTGTLSNIMNNPYFMKNLFGNSGSSTSGNASWMSDPWMQ